MNEPARPHNWRARQRYSFRRRCAAPVPSGRCGVPLEGVQRIPILVNDVIGGRMVPGPVLTHLPCGHRWLAGHGWDQGAAAHSGQ
jgi:hypothetical protein